MGTRCLTVFYGNVAPGLPESTILAVLYRQFDGYPEGHGQELLDFLRGRKLVNGFSYPINPAEVNGMQDLAVRVITYLKVRQAKGQDEPGGFSLRPAPVASSIRDFGKECWAEYIYHVWCTDGGEIMLSVARGEDDFDVLRFGRPVDELCFTRQEETAEG